MGFFNGDERMKIPIWIIIWLPKKMRDRAVRNAWNRKSDEDIIMAYGEAIKWISLSKGVFASSTMSDVADRCQKKLDESILPQIKKRNLNL